jgi:hypothetical protein
MKTEKSKVGRPTTYSQEIADKICILLGEGQTLRAICSMPDMPVVTTIWRWEQKYPEFCKLSAQAREDGTHVLAEECLSIADDPVLNPQDKRVRIDTRLRLIGKWNSKKYGDRIEHEVNHLFIPLDQLAQKIQSLESDHSQPEAVHGRGLIGLSGF